jgi:phosphoribosyl 1,2-cyclic phosphate phosphodiesterase
MSLELLFLGTGTSAGVPMIGCHCEVCSSDDLRDKRSRASVVFSFDDNEGASENATRRRLLIDTAPELRLQILENKIDSIDGVLFTHAHADHIFGMDDLRRFNVVMDAPIDIYAEREVLDRFHEMFRYVFEPHKNANASFIPQLLVHEVQPLRPLKMFGATCTPIRLMHGRLPILGYRVDHGDVSIAYCTDVSGIPPETWPLLEGLDVLVIDALRYRHHPTHLTVDQALEIIDHVKPKQAYLTHIAHEIRHSDLESKLPDGVQIGFDGLTVTA